MYRYMEFKITSSQMLVRKTVREGVNKIYILFCIEFVKNLKRKVHNEKLARWCDHFYILYIH